MDRLSHPEARSLSKLNREMKEIDFAGIFSTQREQILPKYPTGIRATLARDYVRIAKSKSAESPAWCRRSWREANRTLVATDESLYSTCLRIAFDQDELRRTAESTARVARRLFANCSLEDGYDAAIKLTELYEIEPPIPEYGSQSLEACRLRLSDPGWWRRKLKTKYRRNAESIERQLGLVNAHNGLYVSDDALLQFQIEREASEEFLRNCVATNDQGESISLSDVSKGNVSNPAVRRAELMTRLSGFEEYASKHNHVGVMITLTTPSRYHSHYKNTGARNPRWDGSTIDEAHHWLTIEWSRIRSAFHRRGIAVYGFRVTEPHHDGTPHWHLLLFFEPQHRDVIDSIVRGHMLSDSPHEKGAQERHCKIVTIDESKGSATGYFAKYISKNIDGFSVGVDYEDSENARDASDTCVRVAAWSSTWGIRQFQQIGGPPVTVWRELRRIPDKLGGLLEQARNCADVGDWCGYMEAMGGHDTPFRTREIRVLKVWSDEPGLYGDPIGDVVIGVCLDDLQVITRLRDWKIEYKPSNLGSRTCVNNCTPDSVSKPPYQLSSWHTVLNQQARHCSSTKQQI